MSSLALWKAAVEDHVGFLEDVLSILRENDVRFCAIGGVAVNAYAAPVLTEDLDLVVAADDIERVKGLMSARYTTREFEHSFKVYEPGARLQVQFQLGGRFEGYVDRAEVHDVVGLSMPVASPSDLLRAKVEAALEPTRRLSKHFKDLSDIVRLLDAFPELDSELPADARPLLERRA